MNSREIKEINLKLGEGLANLNRTNGNEEFKSVIFTCPDLVRFYKGKDGKVHWYVIKEEEGKKKVYEDLDYVDFFKD